jgi:hypothetical protein
MEIILFILGQPIMGTPTGPRPPRTCAPVAPPYRRPHPPLPLHCQHRSPTVHSRRSGPSLPFSSMRSSSPSPPPCFSSTWPSLPISSVREKEPSSPHSPFLPIVASSSTPKRSNDTSHFGDPIFSVLGTCCRHPHRISGGTPMPHHYSVSAALLRSFSKICRPPSPSLPPQAAGIEFGCHHPPEVAVAVEISLCRAPSTTSPVMRRYGEPHPPSPCPADSRSNPGTTGPPPAAAPRPAHRVR